MGGLALLKRNGMGWGEGQPWSLVEGLDRNMCVVKWIPLWKQLGIYCISDGNRKEYHNNQTYGNKYEQKYRTISHEKQPWEIDMNINIRLPSKWWYVHYRKYHINGKNISWKLPGTPNKQKLQWWFPQNYLNCCVGICHFPLPLGPKGYRDN